MAKLGDCPEAEMLARLIDGDLTRQERDSLEEHIAGCAECYGLLTESTEVWWRLGKSTPGDDSTGHGDG